MDTAIIVAGVVSVASIGVLAWSGRSLWATHRTAHERHKMLDLCKHHTLVYRYWNDLNVSFTEHHSEYMMFRNPWRLYSSQFIDLAHRHGVIGREVYADAYPFAVLREERAKEVRIQKFADELLASANGERASDTEHTGNSQISNIM